MRTGTRGFHTITLGCKLNQFDTAALEGELRRRGVERRDSADDAAVVILNTCTVTHRADSEARRLIRSVRRRNPGCRLLVTGCYAEADADGIVEVGGVDRVFGNREKARFGAVLDELGIGTEPPPVDVATSSGPPAGGARAILDRGCDAVAGLPRALHFGERARAFLKVQEGCRLACSYCIIPTVRGPSRSVPPERVVEAALGLRDDGYREIVLTGVNTGDYGLDLAPRTDLASLLGRLLAAVEGVRLRLNSLEPLTVTDAIVDLLAAEPRIAPHLQIPLQSGSARTLRRMRRNYRLDHYAERLSSLRSRIPDIGLGADVIVGFPGETDADFDESMRFVAGSPLNYLHVFSWSPRGGTHAAELPDRLDASLIRDRSRAMRTLGRRLAGDFRRRFVGRELDAVVLDAPRPNGARRALTGNFIDLRVTGSVVDRGEWTRVRITATDGEGTEAVGIGPAPAPVGADAR